MERYRGCTITPLPQKTRSGRYAVAVQIDRAGKTAMYFADDGITYILKEEAAREGINLAHRLIDRGDALR